MKLVRFGPSGRERPGLIDADGNLRDLSGSVSDIDGSTLSPKALARIAKLKPNKLPLVKGKVRYGPCVGKVGKFVAIGLNYKDHAAETGAPIPKEPIMFMKATSSICGPNDDVIMPIGATKLDWEVELGIVIGSEARNVAQRNALDYVAGFCVVNDVSERAFQIERGGQWVKGKSCDTFGPIGPWLVTRDEVADPQRLDLHLDVNGERMQTGNTRTMIFGVKKIISYVSQFMTLQPGDIITTGTPPGVGMGMNPQRYLKVGDVVSLGIAGLGAQQQKIVRRPKGK